jgi:hypothetical protein
MSYNDADSIRHIRSRRLGKLRPGWERQKLYGRSFMGVLLSILFGFMTRDYLCVKTTVDDNIIIIVWCKVV